MTSLPPSLPPLRTNSISLAFQDVFTVVLRTRFNVQRWDRSDRMRAAVRQMIASATENARGLGYSNETTQMALYAILGFLDESVLNSKDPVFADWPRQTLQAELIGDNLEGERFFRRIAELLNRPESAEVADILEFHCLCLLLGFRGRFAFGGVSEIHDITRRIREKIVRIRGPFALVREIQPPIVPKLPVRDRWVRNLSVAAIILAIVCLAAFLGFHFMLGQSANSSPQVSTIPSQLPLQAQADQFAQESL